MLNNDPTELHHFIVQLMKRANCLFDAFKHFLIVLFGISGCFPLFTVLLKRTYSFLDGCLSRSRNRSQLTIWINWIFISVKPVQSGEILFDSSFGRLGIIAHIGRHIDSGIYGAQIVEGKP